MGFIFQETHLKGAYVIENHRFLDDRGVYQKNFESNIFKEQGINFNITESSDLYTKKGAIRGLHFQDGESQAKLVRVVKGKIYDVIVDLRKDSDTYMKHFSILLEENSNKSLFIPKGFAHGFLAVEDSIFAYHCDGKYQPEYCGGLRWNDPKLEIEWPLDEYGITNLIITEKDKSWKLL